MPRMPSCQDIKIKWQLIFGRFQAPGFANIHIPSIFLESSALVCIKFLIYDQETLWWMPSQKNSLRQGQWCDKLIRRKEIPSLLSVDPCKSLQPLTSKPFKFFLKPSNFPVWKDMCTWNPNTPRPEDGTMKRLQYHINPQVLSYFPNIMKYYVTL